MRGSPDLWELIVLFPMWEPWGAPQCLQQVEVHSLARHRKLFAARTHLSSTTSHPFAQNIFPRSCPELATIPQMCHPFCDPTPLHMLYPLCILPKLKTHFPHDTVPATQNILYIPVSQRASCCAVSFHMSSPGTRNLLKGQTVIHAYLLRSTAQKQLCSVWVAQRNC